MTAEPLSALDGGRGPRGWEALWARDVWRQLDLPHGDLASTYRGEVLVRFDGLHQPWVKEAAKRWARMRLLGDTTPRTMSGLPRSAVIHRGEVPRVGYRLPKEMPDDVFAQWVDSNNLEVLENELHRTIVMLLAYTGFRISSVVTLLRDARMIGSNGHPYLRYWNIKAKRQAALPIPPTLSEQLDRHETFLRERCPDGTDWLIPSPPVGERHGKGGGHHISHSTVQRIVKHYIRTAEIRTGDGRLALDVHPHLFRHHLASSMFAEEVPLLTVQKVLDHGSIEMTAHYGRVHDSTVRQAIWKFHERVNIRGERVALPVDGPLEEAAWMKERIARAKQALPNGYCGLPLVQSCPHPNACLTCPSFLTDASFRSVHEQQRVETERLLGTAREADSVRLVELLERDHASLIRILEGLDAIEGGDVAAEIDVRELTSAGLEEQAA